MTVKMARNQHVIILVEPQMGENIGMCARAMLNFGLTELRIVNPRDGWPNGRAVAASSGADDVVNSAKVFKTVEEATADLQVVYATTPRHHDMIKTTYTCAAAADRVRQEGGEGMRVGVLFGCERTGLTNEHLSRADALVVIPTNPDFDSLNLAQAVIVWAYAWFMTADNTPPAVQHMGKSRPANKDELNNFMDRLEMALDESGFFTSPEKKPGMQHNLRNTFTKMELTEQEIRTLHGVIKALQFPQKR
ncbi:MAG: RNA methyltransferase [Bdellovibrionales bacterium]